MVRPQIAAAILDLAYGVSRRDDLRRDAAIEMTVKIVAHAEQSRPLWWRWTSHLAGAITISRLQAL